MTTKTTKRTRTRRTKNNLPLAVAKGADPELAKLLQQAVGLAGELMSRSYVPMAGVIGDYDNEKPYNMCTPIGKYEDTDRWTRAAAQALACLARRAAVGPDSTKKQWRAGSCDPVWIGWDESPQHATLTLTFFGSVECRMPAVGVAEACDLIRETVARRAKEKPRAALFECVLGMRCTRFGPPLALEQWVEVEKVLRRHVLPRAERWLAATGVAEAAR